MINIKKYAAIDIGSNAVRLLVSDIIEQDDSEEVIFKKNSLVRVPIRLGADVFISGSISDFNRKRMVDTMTAFRLLMNAHGVERYKACATSAMREAKNGKDIAQTILKSAEISIDIIDGDEEATIIAETDLHTYIDPNKTYLYVDVGGGSTEFSIIHNASKLLSQSF
jgi:exopolyphosphatase/guanosine-5'-triphosphate,3'-diphosphate pyrophosphatase